MRKKKIQVNDLLTNMDKVTNEESSNLKGGGSTVIKDLPPIEPVKPVGIDPVVEVKVAITF